MFTPNAGTFTSFNQTSRWSNHTNYAGGVFGDAAGASTVSFTATAPVADWVAIGVSMVGTSSTYTPT
jgi:hypothetical protein